jgi:hypothetical protein
MKKREGILILPEGVYMIPLDNPADLHNFLSEIFNEHPNPRGNLRQDNRISPETPGGVSDDGSPPKSKR